MNWAGPIGRADGPMDSSYRPDQSVILGMARGLSLVWYVLRGMVMLRGQERGWGVSDFYRGSRRVFRGMQKDDSA